MPVERMKSLNASRILQVTHAPLATGKVQKFMLVEKYAQAPLRSR